MSICTKIESVLCPKCKRKLKPSVIYPGYSSTTIKYVLVCRYCNLRELKKELNKE